ncbi:MAG: glycosyltransferase family 39 protein [Flavobacteriales bacterium]|nr:glycosyltransferase family 39 protein [Flavobacteriales bacterium]
MFKQTGHAGWWFTIGVAAVLLLPALAQDGMFMDGMLYTVVAFNLAHGTGTFWEPIFSPLGLAGLPTFHEHPPLGFGIQAMWFNLWGDGFWVERLWCLVTVVLNGALLVAIWRLLTAGTPEWRRLAWWPVLLWITIPVNFWSYQNNMHENSMALFTGGALWLFVAGAMGRAPWLMACVMAGVAVFLASFVKGLPGLFPFAVPFAIQVATGRPGWHRTITGTSIAVIVCVAAYAVLLLSPDAQQSLGTYVNERLLRRIAEKPTVDSHFWIIPRLVLELLPALVLAAVVAWAGRKREYTPEGTRYWALALLLAGLAGVLPLMLTRVQKAFYFTPALGPLALAIGLASLPALAALMERMSMGPRKGLAVSGMALLAVALVLAGLGWGKPGRDADMLHDVAVIGTQVPEGSVIGAHADLWEEWNLQCYLLRYHRIGIDPTDKPRSFRLLRTGHPAPPDCIPMALDLRTYTLLTCPEVAPRE